MTPLSDLRGAFMGLFGNTAACLIKRDLGCEQIPIDLCAGDTAENLTDMVPSLMECPEKRQVNLY